MKKFNRDIYDTLIQAFYPYRYKIVFLIILGLISRILFLSNAQIIAIKIDQADHITTAVLQNTVQSVLAILIPSFILTLIYRVYFSRLCADAVSRIYDETTYRVSRYPLSFFDSRPVGRITTRFSSDYGNVFRLFGGPLAEFFSIVFDLIAVVLIIIAINPLFIIPLTLAAGIYVYILKTNQVQLRQSRSELSHLRAPSIAHFSETVQGSTAIRQGLHHPERADSFIQRFNDFDSLFTTCKRTVFKFVFKFSFQLSLMSFFIFILNAGLSLYLYQAGQLGPGEMTVVISFTLMATTGLQMFFEWYSQFDEALIGVERLNEYLRHPIEPGTALPTTTEFKTQHKVRHENDIPAERSTGHLIIDNIVLKYSEQGPTILNLSLDIPRHQKVGLIGRTGSGKSSLVSCILKLYPLTSGTIHFSDRHYDFVDDYRDNFTVITQDIFFMKGTLRDNLDLIHAHSDQQLIQTLHEIGLDLSLDLSIEEKGQNLSQGEKQLISLARGLLKQSPIIIFDEATANIDPTSEAKVTEIIKNRMINATQIIIAHRLDTLLYCDRVIWLENGQIKKDGPAKEVLEAFTAKS